MDHPLQCGCESSSKGKSKRSKLFASIVLALIFAAEVYVAYRMHNLFVEIAAGICCVALIAVITKQRHTASQEAGNPLDSPLFDNPIFSDVDLVNGNLAGPEPVAPSQHPVGEDAGKR
jgi:hypothetical protein